MQSPCSTIDKLPEEVLLEVFDSYRRFLKYDYSYETDRRHQRESNLVPKYERRWNRKHGWFKLVHVCQKWRRIVLASPFRLDLSLVLIDRNPGNMKTVYTPRLPSLPIRIDYPYGPTTDNSDVDRVIAALKRRDRRVRGIVFKGNDLHLKRVFKEMKCPFPELERLEICGSSAHGWNLQFPPTFLRGSAPRLRRLKMSPVSLESVSKLLSSATALVELSLSIDTIFGSSPTESLVVHLQAMSCLRWLALTLPPRISHNEIPEHREKGWNIVSLSKLTFFHFYGHRLFLDSLVSGLAVPSLQTFDIELNEYPADFTSPIPHIARFIADISLEPEAFRVIFSDSANKNYFSLSLLAHSESIDDPDPHFNFYSQDIMQIGNALSPRLAIVKELFLVSFYMSLPPATPWRTFLELFHDVKVLRLQHKIMLDIAHSLQDQGKSAPMLPSLEEIELRTLEWPWNQDERRSAMELFEPFIAARQEAGRPVKIFWGKVKNVTWKFPRDLRPRLSEWEYTVCCYPSLRNVRFLMNTSVAFGRPCHAFPFVAPKLRVEARMNV